jgi:hypothetical protein
MLQFGSRNTVHLHVQSLTSEQPRGLGTHALTYDLLKHLHLVRSQISIWLQWLASSLVEHPITAKAVWGFILSAGTCLFRGAQNSPSRGSIRKW